MLLVQKIFYCECGRMMIRRPYSGRCADRFQCPNQTYCNNASCTVDEMLDAVCNALNDAISDFEIKLESGQCTDNNDDYLQALHDRLSEFERKEESLWEKYAEGMPPAIFDSLMKKNEQAKSEISTLIQAAENKPRQIDFKDQIVTFSETIAAIRGDIPAAETNALLKSCIKRITYSRERGKRDSHIKGGWDVNPMNLKIELNL